MTDLHVDDGTVQSAGIVGGWLFGIGLVIWGLTFGPLLSWKRKVSKQLSEIQNRCDSCPAEMLASRTAAIDAAKKEIYVEISGLRNHIDLRLDKQDDELRTGLHQLQHNIIAALGVKAARGEAD